MALAMVMGFLRCGDGGKAQREHDAAVKRREEGMVPQITWRDLSYNDTVKVGDTIDHIFVFYNTGYKPVIVKHAIPNRSECTCSVPNHPVEIGAQDTVKMHCVFLEAERVGMEILVEHNTPQPTPTLVYIATVLPK